MSPASATDEPKFPPVLTPPSPFDEGISVEIPRRETNRKRKVSKYRALCRLEYYFTCSVDCEKKKNFLDVFKEFFLAALEYEKLFTFSLFLGVFDKT